MGGLCSYPLAIKDGELENPLQIDVFQWKSIYQRRIQRVDVASEKNGD